MRALLILPALLTLASCDTPMGTDLARTQAKSTVNKVVEKRAPGVDATPVTDCIIDNATGSEIVKIAADGVTGTVSADTTNLVIEIARRQGTIECLVNNVGPLVVARVAAGM